MKTSELINELVDSLKCFGDLPVQINKDKKIKISWFCPSENGSFETLILNSTNVEAKTIEEKPEKIEILGETKQQCSIANNYSKENIQCIVNEFYRKINVLVNKNNELVKAVNYLLEKSDNNV